MGKNKRVIFICGLLLIIVIIISIYNHMNDFEKHYVNNNQEQSLDLNSLYDENSLSFEEKTTVINNVNCTYIQLNGLKKIKIENNINKDIKNNLTTLINQDNFNYDNLYVNISGNFGNVLSIVFYTMDEQESIIIDTLNYNLVNGSELSFIDLFMSNTPVLNFIKDELPIAIQNNSNTNIDLDQEHLLQLYKDSNFNFYFDQFAIYVKLEDLTVEIPYYKYADFISLHTKYLTTVSIYKNNEVSKKDILIASYRDNGIYSILDYTNDNIYTDLVINSSIKSVATDLLNSIKSIADNEIQKISKNNDLKFTYLNQSGILEQLPEFKIKNDEDKESESIQYSIYKLSIDSITYNVLPEYFANELKKDVYSLHRQVKSSDNFVDFTKYETKNNISTTCILLKNGNILENLEDLFVEGYDYIPVIKEYILSKYNLSVSDTDLLLENAKYDYNLNTSSDEKAYSIVVISNNKKIYIPFSIFDRSVMNIY